MKFLQPDLLPTLLRSLIRRKTNANEAGKTLGLKTNWSEEESGTLLEETVWEIIGAARAYHKCSPFDFELRIDYGDQYNRLLRRAEHLLPDFEEPANLNWLTD